MIKTFAGKREDLYDTGQAKRFPPDGRSRSPHAQYVDLATQIDDLKVPPGIRSTYGRP
jgi:proteic killer suppression protein